VFSVNESGIGAESHRNLMPVLADISLMGGKPEFKNISGNNNMGSAENWKASEKACDRRTFFRVSQSPEWLAFGYSADE